MSSSRLILIFLGFIFLIIVILTSSQIASALRKRFGNLVPGQKISGVSITPSPSMFTVTPTPTPVKAIYNNNNLNKGGTVSVPSNQTPATGPEDFAYLLLAGTGSIGIFLKKISKGKV